MSRVNAALTPRARLRLARLLIEDGWSSYLAEGQAAMADRSSHPHHSPAKTSPQAS